MGVLVDEKSHRMGVTPHARADPGTTQRAGQSGKGWRVCSRYMVGISIGSAWYRRPPGCFACGSIIIQPRLKHSIKESLVATLFAQSSAICAVLWTATFIVAGNSANAQQICQTNVGYCSMRSYDQPGHFCRCPYLNGYANVDGVIYNSGSQALLFPRPRSPQQLYSYQQPDQQTYSRPYQQPYQQNYEQPDQQFYQQPYEQTLPTVIPTARPPDLPTALSATLPAELRTTRPAIRSAALRATLPTVIPTA